MVVALRRRRPLGIVPLRPCFGMKEEEAGASLALRREPLWGGLWLHVCSWRLSRSWWSLVRCTGGRRARASRSHTHTVCRTVRTALLCIART